jgi:hypothetical protein
MNRLLVIAALLVLPVTAKAQTSSDWTAISGKIISPNTDLIHVTLGWPGIAGTYWHGMNEKFNVGARFAFNYGYEGMFNATVPGLVLQGIGKVGLSDTARFNAALTFSPGFFSYFGNAGGFGSTTSLGIALPVGIMMGIPASPSLNIGLGAELPFLLTWNITSVTFGGTTTTTTTMIVMMQILFGGGIEYFIDKSLALTFDIRLGPTVPFATGTAAQFTGRILMGVAYKF